MSGGKSRWYVRNGRCVDGPTMTGTSPVARAADLDPYKAHAIYGHTQADTTTGLALH